MSDYPLTHALIVELCGLDEVDAQLPLTVIANLHRSVLRLPLLGMVPLREEWHAGVWAAREAGGKMPPFGDVLAADYQLDQAAIMEDTRVDDAMMSVDEEACATVRARESGPVRGLLDAVVYESRQAYEPLALLYYAGHGVAIEGMLAPVELCLGLVPQLHAFAVARAQMAQVATRPVQSE